jgi:hypothetical protein
MEAQRRILFNHNRAMRQLWISRLVTLLVWLAVGLSAAFWLLRWQGGQTSGAVAQVAVGAAFAADPQPRLRLSPRRFLRVSG